MFDKLLSELSISHSSPDPDPDVHQHSTVASSYPDQNSPQQHRFHADINLHPDRCGRPPRISPDVSYFLATHGEDTEDVLKKPVISVPDYDDSLPLASYFVSTSHNTYLLGDQLWGKASASAYTHVLTNGAHCVEIDVWSGQNGPIVTHGWTLTQEILFRDVCLAINEAVETKAMAGAGGTGAGEGEGADDWPVFVSLECHVEVEGQGELVRIMKEAWGEKLVSGYVGGETQTVSPGELKNRIVMMIEHYILDQPQQQSDSSDSSSHSSRDSEEKHKPKPKPKISDELAALGIYALSIKPKKNWLEQQLENIHILINISESVLLSLLPHELSSLIAHGQRHLRRIYPRGTRILSGNLNPLVSWRAGSHFAALNWQDFDRSMQMNEAMFVGSNGWVPKPVNLLPGEEKPNGNVRTGLAVDVVGLSALPPPKADEDFKVRIHIHLYHESGDKEWKSKSVKCKVPSVSSPSAGIGAGVGVGADAMFSETCTWTFDADELAFLRIIVTHDDADLAVFCARLSHLQQGYRFIRLLDMKGKNSHATLLVNFIFSTIS